VKSAQSSLSGSLDGIVTVVGDLQFGFWTLGKGMLLIPLCYVLFSMRFNVGESCEALCPQQQEFTAAICSLYRARVASVWADITKQLVKRDLGKSLVQEQSVVHRINHD
jgi:hypothetical protein